ncbi:MAG: transposase, partial [Lentisphaerae bacterium]|nr:transposase [Lentisphaerota bacterium]MBE6358748.1 transposase [Lentisphaerota bacterium]MBE6359517.1 transposase [Lentisphaerota bacterium]MBE6359557.1 transposase [Lentisphaerota bacterium]MBE6359759.1 transposase [Lentisphaerota bacterium]
LEEYICYFNNGRVSLRLNGMSPVEFRAHSM